MPRKHQQQPEDSSANSSTASTKLIYSNLNVEEKILSESEIKRNRRETVKYTNTENPFFNKEAAAYKQQIDFMDESLRDWQYAFQKDHQRRPTLREMMADPRIRNLLAERKKKRESIHSAVFKYKVED